MATMEQSFDLPLWAIPIFMLGFPVAFLGIWGLVTGILSTVNGYRSLSPFRISAADAKMGEPLRRLMLAKVGPISYRGGVLSVRSAGNGLTLRVSPLFPFHPPIRVPSERVRLNDGTGRTANSVLLDDRVRLVVPPDVLAAIVAAKPAPG